LRWGIYRHEKGYYEFAEEKQSRMADPAADDVRDAII
jgi:hypothetical protein